MDMESFGAIKAGMTLVFCILAMLIGMGLSALGYWLWGRSKKKGCPIKRSL